MGFPEGGFPDTPPTAGFNTDPTDPMALDGVDLDAYDEDYKDAPEHVDVADGTYHVKFESFKAKDDSKDEVRKPYIEWVFEIVTGPCAGSKLYKRSYVSKQAMPFLKRDLTVAGIVVEKLSDAPSVARDRLGTFFEVVRRTSKNKDGSRGFTNIDIQKPLNGPPAGAAPPEPGPDAFSAPAPQPEAPAQPQAEAPAEDTEAPPQQEAPTNDQNDKQVPF